MTTVHAVSRSADKLDIFVTDANGMISTAAWEPGFTSWHGWWPINNATAVPGGPVTVVSRAPDKLDVFVVGTDDRVWTAAWEPGFTSWRGWWPIGDLRAPQGSAVHAVSRSADKLDIFVTDANGMISTAAWEPGFTSWHGWWPINNATAVPGGPVTVVSRAPDKLDVFVVGTDDRVWTAAWEPGFTSWRGWWPIGDLRAPQGSAVHAVSRSADKLDIFVTDANGMISTAAWEPGFTSWHGWWPINNATAVPGGPVTVVSRAPDKLDVFVVGTDDRVWTAAWEPGFTSWRGWWPIGDLRAPQGSAVHAVSRSADKLDIFVTDANGMISTAAWEPGFTSWHGWWPITTQSDRHGEWRMADDELDIAAVHAALLQSGRVLFFSYNAPQEDNTDVGKWQIWDPDSGPIPTVARDIGRNLFCAGHCFLGDGRLLVAGGQSNNIPPFIGWGADHDIHIFDAVSESWTRLSSMPAARYYPTCTTLPGGSGLIANGAASRYLPTFANVPNDEYEIFDWRLNTRTNPQRFNPGHMKELYPFMKVLPDGTPQGSLFVFSVNEARIFSLENFTWNSERFITTSPFSRTYPHQGTCVVLPLLPEAPDSVKVMVFGGAGENDRATNTAEIFDFNSSDVAASGWRAPLGGDMSHARFMCDAVLLPDQTVLVVSGAGAGAADHSTEPILETQVFDSRSETWTSAASSLHPRMYHSTAILLPSGEVIVGGNTEHWNPSNPVEDKTLEIFRPPYLFRGDRPQLLNAPQSIAYGEQFVVQSPEAADISHVAFMRCGSVTHSNNMDQRHVGLRVVSVAGDDLTIQAPNSRAVAPPGFYMLFLLNSLSVPSVGAIIHLDPSASNPQQQLVADAWFTVRESDSGVDTGLDVLPQDDIAFEATGEIWAGVALTGRNGPRGWTNVDHDPKFPLHEGADAHPFALIGTYDGTKYFYIGARRDRAQAAVDGQRRLTLRTNDDMPGNGNGEFRCRVQIWR